MQAVLEPIPKVGIPHDIHFEEGRTEYGRMSHFATQTTADATVQHRRNRVIAQGVGVGLYGQGRTAR